MTVEGLHCKELTQTLDMLRGQKKRDYWKMLVLKLHTLNEWFSAQGLHTALVRVEPTTHSRLAAHVAWSASRLSQSPIHRLMALCTQPGLEGQTQELRDMGFEVHTLWTGGVQAALASATGFLSESSRDSQLLKEQATACVLNVLREKNPALATLGHIDRDQAAYLGAFSQAVEGACDVQIFTDLYRSEVFEMGSSTKLAEPLSEEPLILTVSVGTQSICSDEMELFSRLADLPWEIASDIQNQWGPKAKRRFMEIQQGVSRIRDFRQRIYRGCSPSTHLDFRPPVPGGWTYKTWN